MDEEDLRLAAELGWLVLPVNGLEGGVLLTNGVLRYDPLLPSGDRARAVCRALRKNRQAPID